jgi:hypothetical protein
MYADIDRRGLVSLFELSTSDTDALLEAMKQYKETLQAVHFLIEGNEYTKRMMASIDKMMLEIQHIITKRDE